MKIILPNGVEARLRFKWLRREETHAPRECQAILTVANVNYSATSRCAKEDTPCRATGRRVALRRLLEENRGAFGYAARQQVWQVYFANCNDLSRGGMVKKAQA